MILPLIMLLVLVLFVTAWAIGLKRLFKGQSLLDFSSREPTRWSLWHLLGMFVVYMVLSVGGMFVVQAMDLAAVENLPEESSDIVAALISMIATTPLLLFCLALMSGGRWSDLGLRRGYTLPDLRLGALAFGALAPFLYGLNWLLSQVFDGGHPFIEMLQENPGLLVLATFCAVVIAPITEEFVFRALVQGWLENIFSPVERKPEVLLAEDAEGTDLPAARFQGNEAFGEEASDVASLAENPYLAPRAQHGAGEIAVAEPQRGKFSPLPILISSLLFAGVHLGHGPAPISIFFLALLLGYLYQRTHRILPCIAVHMSLNACSMAVLWLSPSA